MLYAIFVGLFLATVGIISSVAGYKLFKIILPIWGFFAGFAVGSGLIAMILGDGFLATAIAWSVALFTGLIFAVFSYFFYYIGIVIVGAAFGVALGTGLMFGIGFDPGLLVTVVAIVSGLLFAILSVIFNFQKYIVVFITSVLGASAVIGGVLVMLDKVTIDSIGSGNFIYPVISESFFWALIWFVLLVAGIVAQSRTSQNTELGMKTYTVTSLPTYN